MSHVKLMGLPGVMNGDLVVGFTDAKTFKADFGHLDKATLSSWYEEDPTKNHLGLVELFSGIENRPLPMYLGALKNGGIIEVNGPDGEFTYDLPVAKNDEMMTMEDTSTLYKQPGKEGGIFEVVLNRRLDPGITFGYDLIDGAQAFVAPEIESQREGDNWRHYCRLVSMDRESFFPNDKLRAGISYFVVGHGLSEFATKFASPYGMDRASSITCKFQLGNHRGVESSTTMYAGMKNFKAADDTTRGFVDKAMQRMESMGEINGGKLTYAMIGVPKKQSNGRVGGDFSNGLVASTLELFCMAYMTQLEYRQLMFQRAGVMESENSVVRLNEGYYHQIRRGFTISYGRKGGITREHIKAAADYAFRNSQLDYTDRYMVFKAGPKAYDNVVNGIFRDEFYSQLSNLGTLWPSSQIPTIKNPVTGQNGELFMNAVKIGGVYLPGIGNVRLELDHSLGYQEFTDRSQFIDGKTPRTAYSLIIENITDPGASNAFSAIPNTSNAKLGNINQNVYYVKPQGPSLFWGTENGRWRPDTATDIVSSMSKMAYGFWCHSMSACWVRDVSRYVTIELAA